jgi:hypothetical protein
VSPPLHAHYDPSWLKVLGQYVLTRRHPEYWLGLEVFLQEQRHAVTNMIKPSRSCSAAARCSSLGRWKKRITSPAVPGPRAGAARRLRREVARHRVDPPLHAFILDHHAADHLGA